MMWLAIAENGESINPPPFSYTCILSVLTARITAPIPIYSSIHSYMIDNASGKQPEGHPL